MFVTFHYLEVMRVTAVILALCLAGCASPSPEATAQDAVSLPTPEELASFRIFAEEAQAAAIAIMGDEPNQYVRYSTTPVINSGIRLY